MFALVLAMTVAADGSPRRFPVTPFHAVELATRATVQVEQAPVASVVAMGDPRFVRCVTANVKDGRLVIGWAERSGSKGDSLVTSEDIVVNARADCRQQGNPQRLLIRVAAPAISDVALREAGIIQVFPVTVAAFSARIDARGSITIDGLHAGVTRLSIAGIGRIAATGELGQLDVTVAGNGIIDTRAAHARAMDVWIAGHGTVAATVDGSVTGSIAGSGAVSIGGHPACSIRTPGHGRVFCAGQSRKDNGK